MSGTLAANTHPRGSLVTGAAVELIQQVSATVPVTT